MTTPEPLQQRVLDLVDDLLVRLEPKRHIPQAEAICGELVACWPTDEEGFNHARDELAVVLSDHLAHQPERWASATHLVSLYLNGAKVAPSHPLGRGHKAGRSVDPNWVELNLHEALAAELLARGNPQERLRFFDALESGPTWNGVARAIHRRSIRLSGEEVIAFLRERSFILPELKALDLLASSLKEVREVVEGWLKSDGRFAEVTPSQIQFLVLQVLRHESALGDLSIRLVNRLLRLPLDQGMQPAMSITAWCWPDGTPMTTRHAAILDLLSRVGANGVEAALRVIWSDPAEDWKQAFTTLDAILSIPAELTPPIAGAWLSVLFKAADQTKRADHLEIGREVLRNLPPLELVLPSRHNLLDEVLDPLAAVLPDDVREVMLSWAEAHLETVIGGEFSFLNTFHRTAMNLPQSPWLLHAAGSNRENRRLVALSCLSESMNPQPPTEGYEGLSPAQVLAIAHTALGHPGLLTFQVRMVFALARHRPDCLDGLFDLLIETLEIYPGECQRALEAWVGASASLDEAHPAQQAIRVLEEAVAKRKGSLDEWRPLIPLLEALRPAALDIEDLAQRRFGEMDQIGREGIMAVIPRVPVVCGEGTAFNFGSHPEKITALKTHSMRYEVHARAGRAPLDVSLEMARHRRRAQEILEAT